jgi:hypothetical protein
VKGDSDTEKCIIKAKTEPVSLTDEEQQQQNKVDRDVFHFCSH